MSDEHLRAVDEARVAVVIIRFLSERGGHSGSVDRYTSFYFDIGIFRVSRGESVTTPFSIIGPSAAVLK